MKTRVDKIFSQLEERKKVNQSSRFRSFMNTQKTDLSQMSKPKQDDFLLVEQPALSAAATMKIEQAESKAMA